MSIHAIVGEKLSMTQFFDENGNAYAATMVRALPTVVTDVRSEERDGYTAVQLGYGSRKEKNINKAQKKAWGDMGSFAHLVEFRMDALPDGVEKGTTFDPFTIMNVGDTVHVTGTSKGKGFQGVVKRHNFAGGRRSHGQKHSEREPGSIGATGPGRVFKGTRMGGRMGSDRIRVKNLSVLAVDPETNTLLVKGAVPGRRGTLLEIVKEAVV